MALLLNRSFAAQHHPFGTCFSGMARLQVFLDL